MKKKSIRNKNVTTAEKFYLNENPNNLSIQELVKELGYTTQIIKRYLKPEIKQKKIVEKTEEIKETKSKEKIINPSDNVSEVMGKRYSKNGQHIASVMTEGASQISDETRNKRGSVRLSDAIKSSIHKPKG